MNFSPLSRVLLCALAPLRGLFFFLPRDDPVARITARLFHAIYYNSHADMLPR
jgi:hypothetical protein